MTINRYLTYRIIDTLKRSKSNDEDYQDFQTYLTYDQKDKNKIKYILRQIDLEKLTDLTEFIKELSWYKQFDHTNLMSLKDCFLFDTKLYLLKPYAPFGSCADLLNTNPYGIREQLIAHILWQTLQALRYLHDRHIIHRAITSKNIYLCDNGRVLLDNFSHCISMISSFDGKLKRQINDYTAKAKDQLLYLAPEVIYQNTTGYNLKSDIYSLGTVACELANGTNIYTNMLHENLSMLYAKIQGSEPILLDQTQLTNEIITFNNNNTSYIEEIKKRKYTKEFHSFIKSCVTTRLELRCSSDELYNHSFFKYHKKLNHNQHILYNEMVKLLEIYKKQGSINAQMKNIEEIFVNSTTEQMTSWEF
ncbi:unnamed protein product [Adineta steineri]|uniref:Protein kinase domain-containing protein n=1 Tax=Adineta steineri TaxID=433720 RepID=A0A818N0N0_9BILA|nr:unnamed protein product [Adineta steineri]